MNAILVYDYLQQDCLSPALIWTYTQHRKNYILAAQITAWPYLSSAGLH